MTGTQCWLRSLFKTRKTRPANIEVEPFLDAVRQVSDEAAGFEIGVYSFRLLDDELDEILAEDFNRILIISLGIGLIILIIAFRALVAAIIPLVMAIGSIFTAIGIAALVSQVYPLVELYAEMILLMGLALGIDYSLFIVSRYRTERSAGRDKMEAISVASNTTGRAVFYAGITVVLSLAGLMLTRDFTFISLALGAIIVVFVAVVASMTLLPALLSVIGDNVNRWRIPVLGKESDRGGIWAAITKWVLARPIPLAGLTIAALVIPHDSGLFHESGIQCRGRRPSPTPLRGNEPWSYWNNISPAA